MPIIIKAAELADIDGVVQLQQTYHISTIHTGLEADGFVTTAFTSNQLRDLIEQEKGLFVALDEGIVVGYLMAGSWEFWANWPVQSYMMQQLHRYMLDGTPITTSNSYQYGPICIAQTYRGSGLLENLFGFALCDMAARYDILVTFVNKKNLRSMRAHIHKLHLQDLGEFSMNDQHYAWLACRTSRRKTALMEAVPHKK